MRVYCDDDNRPNGSFLMDNVPKLEDWEHKLKVNKYLENYRTHKDESKAWAENKGKCYYLLLQHCPPKVKPEPKNSAWWALLLIFGAWFTTKRSKLRVS